MNADGSPLAPQWRYTLVTLRTGSTGSSRACPIGASRMRSVRVSGSGSKGAISRRIAASTAAQIAPALVRSSPVTAVPRYACHEVGVMIAMPR